ncbi:MAG: DNA-3-methyladenine glycosylase [Defluviitaleaceae bacterium]|nr:DNA-3-methyladenine glycosylase [Defluviitaleaceae bacterium]
MAITKVGAGSFRPHNLTSDKGDKSMKKLEQSIFLNHSAKDVAKELLGKIICHKAESGIVSHYRIIETEAYAGDCPYVFKETQFYTVAQWIAHENMLMITCSSKESPDNVVIRSVAGHNGPEAPVDALGIISGEAYPHDTLWLEDDGTIVAFAASERSFLPDGNLVNFKVTEA